MRHAPQLGLRQGRRGLAARRSARLEMASGIPVEVAPRYASRLSVGLVAAGIQKKGPAAVGPPGSLGGNAQRAAPHGDATSTGRPMLTLSDQGRGPSSASPNFKCIERKDVADRAKNQRGKQIADVCEGP